MAGMLPCSNEDGNAATFMISNLAGDEQSWVCGYCLGMLGLATLVELGAVTDAQVKVLLNAGETQDQADADTPADKPKRTRKKAAAGKVTGDTGETTPPAEGPCELGAPGCEGTGIWIVDPYDEDVNNTTRMTYLCKNCFTQRAQDI